MLHLLKHCQGSNVVCIFEGLGNQMFQYAFAKKLEMNTGRKVYIDAESLQEKVIGEELGSNTVRAYGLDNFKISLPLINNIKRSAWNYTRGDKWYYEIIKELNENGKYPYNYLSQKGFNDISLPIPSIDEISSNTYIKGWFQSEKYFCDIRDILLKEFVPKERIVFPKHILRKILEKNSVSVHIRRGDYKSCNMVLDDSYYCAAMDVITARINNPVWIVFSDEICYVKENYPFKGEVIFIDDAYGLKDYEQMLLMSKCRHNIIANSTFSWWGAWLNQNENKCVVAPMKWISSQKNIVPSDWIKVRCESDT